MINYEDWLEKNMDRLEQEYDEYCEELDNTIIMPLEFWEYTENKYDSMLGDYQDRKYDEWKERDI